MKIAENIKMIEKEKLTEIGKFLKTHALDGELNTILDIDEDYIENGNPLIVEKEGIFVPFYVASLRTKGASSFLIRLEGVDNVEQAKTFVNHIIYAPTDLCNEYIDEQPEDGRIYLKDLIGYTIVDTDGLKPLGKIIDIDESTENALFICSSSAGEIMIPAADDLVIDVNTENKIIEMEIPLGLINN